MKIYPRVKPSNFKSNQVALTAHLLRHAKNQIALGAESIIQKKTVQANACIYSVDLLAWEAERVLSLQVYNIFERSLIAHCARVQRFHTGARLP